MVEKQIIKLFCEDKELFTKYYKYVNINYIKINYNELYKLFNIIDLYYNKYNNYNNININDLDIILDYDEFSKLEILVKKNIGILEYYNNHMRWFFDLTNEYNKINPCNKQLIKNRFYYFKLQFSKYIELESSILTSFKIQDANINEVTWYNISYDGKVIYNVTDAKTGVEEYIFTFNKISC